MTDMPHTDRGWRALLEPGHRGPLALISAGIGMHAFNDLSIAASVPVAYADLGALPLLPLAYALFFIGVVSGGILSARIRDRIGARRTALAAACLFLTGVTLTATAPAGWVFATGRAMQGLSDGVIAALCYSLIPELFRPALVPRVFSVEAVVWALAAALGPLAGGFATEYLDWRAAMLVCLPFALAFLATVPATLPRRARDAAPVKGLIPWPAAVCLLGAVALSLPSALPETRAAVLALPLGLGLFAFALTRDRLRTARFFPSDAFRQGTVGRATWAIFLMPVAQATSSVFLPLALRETFALSPVWVGWIAVTMAMCWSLSAMWVAGLSDAGRHATLRFGPLSQVVGAACIAAGLSSGTLPLVVLGHGLAGIGFGCVWGPANHAIMAATPPAEKARTSSFMPTVQTTGFAVGAGLAGWVAAASALIPALQAGTAGAAVLLLWGGAACIAALTLIATLPMGRDVIEAPVTA